MSGDTSVDATENERFASPVANSSAMKTSMGKLLADALQYYYFDCDNLVEEAAGGGSAGKSFRERDKEGFSESEGMSKDVSINKFFDEAMVVELSQQATDLHQQMI
ncbi:hypothetical protein LOK49_LG12G02805 [Camellia lanceoleosa]|uniref:Uncharacterized protein n=1 Tax=Camellia lanceoleosa TaxID=1840588 RepID=A0ACC0FTX9_9ERIC|nr:hypothetical protein LOK49_LG12G02805 [Camellia lanceoleosa]